MNKVSPLLFLSKCYLTPSKNDEEVEEKQLKFLNEMKHELYI